MSYNNVHAAAKSLHSGRTLKVNMQPHEPGILWPGKGLGKGWLWNQAAKRCSDGRYHEPREIWRSAKCQLQTISVCDNKWCLCMSLYIHIRIDRIEWYVSNSWRHNRTRQKFAMPKGATSPRPLGTVLKRRKHHNSCAMSSQRPRFADLIQVAFLPVGSLPSNWDVKTSCQLHQLPYQIKAGYLCGAP